VTRTIVWFSAGAASAVAAKVTLSHTPDAVITYVNPGSEHPDNERFLDDCAQWFGRPILRLRSDRYVDTWQVWEDRRFLVGQHGAPCTIELKKKVRFAFERPDDIQVFGYTADETHRADRFRQLNPEIALDCPLIDRGLTKEDCLAIVERAGIQLPVMYRLGFQNNNCIGCPKGGMGYWNHIRRHFPDTYTRMARLERELDHAVNKDADGPVWLDELDPNRGDLLTESPPECSLLCAITEADIT
jgi:3'-phosphoadenosine 5'-phosphosulfate sulfotransferase (PAPS reductase)/FAD synthetase